MDSFIFIHQQHHLEEVLDRIYCEPKICLDLESGGLNPWENKLLLLQIATPHEVFIIDTRRVDIEPLKEILESKNTLKILQNAKFDYQFLKLKAGIALRNIFDTMIAEHILNAGRIEAGQSKLSYLALKHSGEVVVKPEIPLFNDGVNIFTQQQLEYAEKDVQVLWGIYSTQRKQLRVQNLITIAVLEFNAIPAISEMELNGVLIDQENWRDFLDILEKQKQDAARMLYEFFAPVIPQTSFLEDVVDINLRSIPQVKKAFEDIGIELEDTTRDTLRKVNHPATLAMVEFRKYEKLLNTYGENIFKKINPITGRIHADWGQAFTDTGRLSCRNPNLQNIPIRDTKKFRECFIAEKGNKLISADYSQIELRIIADHSKDDNLIAAFNSNKDIHRLTAQAIFGKKRITKDMRDKAKNMVYGMSYGLSAEGFARKMNIGVSEAEQLVNRFRNQYPRATRWLYALGKRALISGYAKTKLGRKRWFPVQGPIDWKDRMTYKWMREARNMPIQGGSADMVKMALAGIQENIDTMDIDAKIVLSVHDEICVEVPEEQVPETKDMVWLEMIKAGEEIVKEVSVEVNVVVGNTWNKEKED